MTAKKKRKPPAPPKQPPLKKQRWADETHKRRDARTEIRDQRIQDVVEWIVAANLTGRDLTTSDVMTRLDISRPTALAYLEAARGLITGMTQDANIPVALGLPHPETPTESPKPAAMLTSGIDMATALSRSMAQLESVCKAAVTDLDQIRHWVYGSPPGTQYPGLCRRCGTEHARNIAIPNPPPVLVKSGLSIGDLTKMYAQLLAAHGAIANTVDKNNKQLENFYSMKAVHRFMVNMNTAIKNVAPQYARAIAAEVRRLHMDDIPTDEVSEEAAPVH